MKKIVYIFLFFFLFAGSAVAGQRDSLINVLDTASDDTVKAKIYCALGALYVDTLPDSARAFYEDALKLSRQAKNDRVIAFVLSQYGYFYFQKGLYAKALEYYLERLPILEKLGDKKAVGRAFGQVGNVFIAIRDFDKGLDYQRRALAVYYAIDDKISIGNGLNNIGVNFFNRKDYDSAMYYFERSKAWREQIGDKKGLSTSYGNIGNVYAERKENEKALEFMKRALDMHLELKNVSGQALTLSNIGALYVQMKKPDEALNYLNKGLDISLRSENLGTQEVAYENLSKAWEMKNDMAKAFDYYKKWVAVKDSSFNQESAQELTRKQMAYEFNRKQEQEKAEREKIELVQKEDAKKEQVFRYVVISGFVLLLISLLIVLRGYRQKQRTNRLLELSKHELEEQRKEISDSIDYAKLIQRAILPVPSEIEAAFSDIFGLFKPKDVVSGDFYWFSRTEKYIFIAAADCTGHGVPGAFMSSIGSEKLSEGVNIAAIDSPAQLLSFLNKGVKEMLRQEEEGSRSRDGMDIALLRFDTERKELTYAGANRPLWIIRDDRVIGYETTKAPIGGLTPAGTNFSEETITLHPGDRIYIFTDGYADQFGGPHEKKFMTARLRELLLSIHRLPMREQEQALEKAHAEWKGDLTQTDDVLVIGIGM